MDLLRTGHGQDLLPGKFHPMRFLRVSFRLGDNLRFVLSPHDVAAGTRDRLGHGAPPCAIIDGGSWARFGAPLANVWNDAPTNLSHGTGLHRIRNIAAGRAAIRQPARQAGLRLPRLRTWAAGP